MCANAKDLCGSGAMQSPITADSKFRHAVLEGLDRTALISSIGATGVTSVPRDGWWYLGDEPTLDTSSNPATGYDPAKAAADLDAAGYRLSASCHDGLGRAALTGACIDLSLVTTTGDPARSGAQVTIQADLQQMGIFTTLTQVPPAKMFGGFADGGVLYTHQFDLAMYSQTLSIPGDPDSWFASYHADCGGTCKPQDQIPSAADRGIGQNDTGEDNPTVDALLGQGRDTA